jgi:hypothetical protein
MYKGKSIKMTVDFSTEIFKARRAWNEVFITLNKSNFSARILYLAKLPFKIDRELKIFHNKQKLKQYMTTKPPLQKILQGILHTEDESKQNHEGTKRQIIRNLATHNQILKQQKQLIGRNHHIPININTESQWTQLLHEKTTFCKMNEKEISNNVLFKRDPQY